MVMMGPPNPGNMPASLIACSRRRLLWEVLSRDPSAMGYHDILRQGIQHRLHLILRMALQDAFQADDRGEIQKVLKGGSQYAGDQAGVDFIMVEAGYYSFWFGCGWLRDKQNI